MSEEFYEEPRKDPVYVSRTQRARSNKVPSKSTSMGTVEQVRYPNAENRNQLVAGILEQNKGLVQDDAGKFYFKPVTVGSVELKLEPIQPSIGTIVHGIDLAKDLEDSHIVAFLRELWLERRVLLCRNQNPLARQRIVEFVSYFSEVGLPFGESEHVPNSPHDLNQQVKDPEIPNMLILPSDETVPNVSTNWHSDATWQKRTMASVLMCREAPPIGETPVFAIAIPCGKGCFQKTKQCVEHLSAEHVGTKGHQMDGINPEAIHPVTRTHPETGPTTLYVQQGFVRRFAEEHQVPEEEEKRLLLEMKFQEGQPECTCRIKWQPATIARAAIFCHTDVSWKD